MKKITNLLLILCLMFSTGCRRKNCPQPIVAVPSPSNPGSPVPSPSPIPEPGPVPAPTPDEQQTIIVSIQGFAIPSGHPELSQVLYVLIERGSDGAYHAFVDLDGQAYDLINWEYQATSLTDGSTVTATEANASCITIPTDFIPVSLKGHLNGRCSQNACDLNIQFVSQSGNTVVTGEITTADGPLLVQAHQGFCLDNGYQPAWERSCP